MTSHSRHRRLSDDALTAVAERFRALGAPSRLRVLSALMDGPLGMSELAEATGLTQSNLSRQVSALEAADCVRRRRAGREVIVDVADPKLYALCELMCSAVEDAAARRLEQVRTMD